MRSDRSLETLYVQYGPQAKRLAFLLVGNEDAAQDLLQDAFARILGRFGNLRRPDDFQAYLRRTIVNLARRRWALRAREKAFFAVEERSLARASEPSDVATRDAVRRALMQLPVRQRAAIVLRYYEDLSESQTAATLDCSVGAVKQLTARALAALRTQGIESENE